MILSSEPPWQAVPPAPMPISAGGPGGRMSAAAWTGWPSSVSSWAGPTAFSLGAVHGLTTFAHCVTTLILGLAFHARSAVRRWNAGPRSPARQSHGAPFSLSGLALIPENRRQRGSWLRKTFPTGSPTCRSKPDSERSANASPLPSRPRHHPADRRQWQPTARPSWSVARRAPRGPRSRLFSTPPQ
jgi:hypothetical protein